MGRVLRDRPHARLVLFRFRGAENSAAPTLDVEEFEAFHGIEDQIEWHDIVPLSQLPEKIARFDVNIAPLEVGNPFCEAKSELKFFEAALVDVPTVASPTGPFRRAIRDGETGFLAKSPDEWHTALLQLVDDSILRRRIARAAHNDVLWRYGPLRRTDAMLSAIPQLRGDGQSAARAFALEGWRQQVFKPSAVPIPETKIVFEWDQFGDAEVAVVVPLHSSAQDVEEALESVRTQTLQVLDLIVVDDGSTDSSLSVAAEWARCHSERFNRIIVLSNRAGAGLGLARNAGIDAADTPWVLSLDLDKRLLPECGAICLSAVLNTGAAFAYSQIRQLANPSQSVANSPFDPQSLIHGKSTDFIALVSREAWAAANGYTDCSPEQEEFDFCRRLVQAGFWGCPTGNAPLADQRADRDSKVRSTARAASVEQQFDAARSAAH